MADAGTEALIHRAAAGDADAFEELVRAHHRLVIRWAVAAVGDLDEAEDLAQAVWQRVHHHLAEFRGASRFTSWLYRITWNLGYEARRIRDRRAAALADWRRADDIGASVQEPQHDGDARLLARAVSASLAQLSPRQRAVLTLVDFEGRPTAEVAEMLEIEETTVRTTLFKARRAMRERLLIDAAQLIAELRG